MAETQTLDEVVAAAAAAAAAASGYMHILRCWKVKSTYTVEALLSPRSFRSQWVLCSLGWALLSKDWLLAVQKCT